MTVDTRPYEGRLVDESFKKRLIINYKPFTFMQNLAIENILNIQQIIRGLAFQLLY